MKKTLSGLDPKLVEIVESYLRDQADPDVPVCRPLSPEELSSKFDLTLPDATTSPDGLYELVERYLAYAVRTGHRQFFNQLWSGFEPAGFLGELVAVLANTSMYTYEVAPVATLMEKALIRRLGRMAGYSDPEGLFISGGSMSNLQAMLLARHRAMPEVKRNGFRAASPLVAFVSAEAHYSFEKAANVLGLGSGQVVKIGTDGAGRMSPAELEGAVTRSRDAGMRPFFVAGTAGTTVKGAFDPLADLAAVAEQNGLWFHVDGALGGAVLFSPRHRALLQGLERADSFVWNAHKLMGLPLMCSVLLVRRRGSLLAANSAGAAEYLFHADETGGLDLGPLSLQCGRRADALKLWFAWQASGTSGFAERVDRLFGLAELAEAIVERTPRLELAAPRTSVNVCFRYRPVGAPDGSDFNIRLREELARRGQALVNYASLGGRAALRLVIANGSLTPDDVTRFFDRLLRTAEELDG